MKRNLSSQAIRAMAIGMAVTLGSATAVSGVVTGTVVNAYAAETHNNNVTVGKTTLVDSGSKVQFTLDGKKDGNASVNGVLSEAGSRSKIS